MGEERRDRAGVSAPQHSCTGAFCGSKAWQLFPRWRTGPGGYWPSAALLPKKAWRLFCAAALLLSIELHQKLCSPPLSLKMDADDSPPDMCVICARLALLSSQAAGRLFLVLKRPRSGFCWGESLPGTALASPGLAGGETRCLPSSMCRLELAEMLRCSPAEGLVWHLCGVTAEKGTLARSAGTHLDVAAWETRSVGLFGGRGTGRSSWCCCRAWKSKPTPSHVHPPWLTGWKNGSPLPSAPGLLPRSCSGNPFGGAEGFAGGSPGEMLGTSCPASPLERLTVGNMGAAIWLPHYKDVPPLKSSCNSRMFEPFLNVKVCPSNPGAAACSIATGCCLKHPSHICMLGCSGVPAYLEGGAEGECNQKGLFSRLDTG